MARFALWEITEKERAMPVRTKSGGKEGKRKRGSIPNIMTATSTEHKTPSSYAFLKRPVLR